MTCRCSAYWRDSGAATVVPEIIVQDGRSSRAPQGQCTVPRVHENFCVITTRRRFHSTALKWLLR